MPYLFEKLEFGFIPSDHTVDKITNLMVAGPNAKWPHFSRDEQSDGNIRAIVTRNSASAIRGVERTMAIVPITNASKANSRRD